MNQYAALIRCVALDGHASAALVVRNRSRGRRIRSVGGCDFNSCLVGLGASNFGWRAFPEPYTSGAATWSRPEGEAGSPRIRHFNLELARTIRTSGRSAWRGAVIPRESGLFLDVSSLNFPTACSLQGHTQSGFFTNARFISEFTQPLLEQRS